MNGNMVNIGKPNIWAHVSWFKHAYQHTSASTLVALTANKNVPMALQWPWIVTFSKCIPSLSQIKRMDIGKNIKNGGLEKLFFFSIGFIKSKIMRNQRLVWLILWYA